MVWTPEQTVPFDLEGTVLLTCRQIDRQTEQTYSQTDRQKDSQMDNKIDKQFHRTGRVNYCRLTDRQINRQTEKQIDG